MILTTGSGTVIWPPTSTRSGPFGAVHVPRQRMGAVTSAAQKRPERFEVRRQTTIPDPIVRIVEHKITSRSSQE
jgi:hypothetical protein